MWSSASQAVAVAATTPTDRSFSRAADRLHVVQSAVSATVRNLEREWGVTLFDRSTPAVALSAAGAALLPEARAALRAADMVAVAAEEARGGLRGTIRVGIMQAHHRAGGISVAYEINDLATIVDFVRHGLAVALLPPVAVAADDLPLITVRRHAPRFEISLVTLPERQVSPAARAFTETARQNVLT